MSTTPSRAIVTPKTRHVFFRLYRADAEATLWNLTLRQVIEASQPGLWEALSKARKINESEMTIELPNGSVIMVMGLDDSTRQERILGQEFATIAVDEVSQFRSFEIFQKLIGRLNDEKEIVLEDKPTGRMLAPKMFLLCNPPRSKRHWTFDCFMRGVNPISQEPHPRPHEWAQLQMNPIDNQENISSTYLQDLENMSAADRLRFLEGEWGSENENGMFKPAWWQGDGVHRRLPTTSPEDASGFDRKIVTVDPAGSASIGADETGIIVAGRSAAEEGREPEAFILADKSGRMTPEGYAKAAVKAFREWDADYILVEKDGLGEHAKALIAGIDPTVPVQLRSTQGVSKPSRALPVAAMYERGRVHHCGKYPALEAQMEEFHLDWSRSKEGSPDRLDAMVYAVRDLLLIEEARRGASQQRFSLFT